MHKYQHLNLKTKLSKQPEQEQNYSYKDNFKGYQLVGGGQNGGKGAGIKKYKLVDLE